VSLLYKPHLWPWKSLHCNPAWRIESATAALSHSFSLSFFSSSFSAENLHGRRRALESEDTYICQTGCNASARPGTGPHKHTHGIVCALLHLFHQPFNPGEKEQPIPATAENFQESEKGINRCQWQGIESRFLLFASKKEQNVKKLSQRLAQYKRMNPNGKSQWKRVAGEVFRWPEFCIYAPMAWITTLLEMACAIKDNHTLMDHYY